MAAMRQLLCTLAEYLLEQPNGALRVGPFPKPLTAVHEFELDAAAEAWEDSGFRVERLEDDVEACVVAIPYTRLVHLIEPGGRKMTLPLFPGQQPREHYDIKGTRWTCVRVDDVAATAELEEVPR
jgi:hypothetical protein